MNVNRFKNSKPFSRWDTAVYLVVAFLIFLLFLFFVIIPKTSDSESLGFTVTSNEKTVVSYSYGSKNFKIDSDFTDLVVINEVESGYNLTIYTDVDKVHFNTLFINEENKTVKMASTDCRSKQCTYLHEVGSKGIIYCAPRSLKISPLSGSGFIPPVVG